MANSRKYVLLGVGENNYPASRDRYVGLCLPWWFLSTLFSLAPARALWTWRRTSHRPPHACPGCGYDLRATPAATGPLLPTCPECGRPTAVPASA